MSTLETGAAPADPPRAPRSAWFALFVVTGGLFVAVVSTTVVSVALPTIGYELHASAAGLQWVVDAYVVVYAGLLVAGGALGDRYGRKRLFLLGCALFGAGSLGAALAPVLPALLAGRVVQGLGAALMVPGGLAIIRALFEHPRQRATAIGWWSTSSGLALATGPPLGGLLVAGLGWRWVFAVNVPLVLGLLLGGFRLLPALPGRAEAGLDLAGVVLSAAGVAFPAVAVIEGQATGWWSSRTLGAFALGAVSLVAFVVIARRRAEPLIDVSLFARRGFAVANAAAFVVFFAFVGAVVYFSTYFQQVRGYSALGTGVCIAVIGVTYALTATWTGRLVGRSGERLPLVAGLVLSGLATLVLLGLGPATGVATILITFAVLGAGIGLCGTPITTLAMSAVGPARAGQASAVVNASRQIGQVFGVAVLGALVYAGLPGTSGTGRELSPEQTALLLTGLHRALGVCAAVLLGLGLIVGLLFAREATYEAAEPGKS
ncbi:MFS transporter [Actinopolyspora erythraea]|uniref:MFS transporter n=1 Tax=Actinopolyspora erythraea TaxID=414996 RepID=A0A223RT21_9ACTN|nr:MFS transporter [Actinopolyspora erythraea]ASU79000.1 MFS transporter [Actinopolyspora erythraea]